jgi:hypothetical protein
MITKSQALAKLAANPIDAAAFDAATQRDHPGLTRDEAVQLTVDALNLKRDRTATLAALKKQSADLKLKLSKLKAAVAIKAAALKPVAVVKPAPQAGYSVTITASGITSHSQRGGRALKLSKSNQ